MGNAIEILPSSGDDSMKVWEVATLDRTITFVKRSQDCVTNDMLKKCTNITTKEYEQWFNVNDKPKNVCKGGNILKLKEFLQCKSTTSFRIPSHFLTNIEFSHRVLTSTFLEIYVWELTTESEYDSFFKVSKHRGFLVCPSTKISSTTKPKLWLKLLDISK